MTGAASGEPGHGDPACDAAHGHVLPDPPTRRLVAVFASPVATELVDLARRCAWEAEVVDGAPTDLDAGTDVVVCDHDRPELGEVLAAVLAQPTRWVGVMGSLRHTAPHVEALRALGVDETDIARVHRPIGLDVGSRTPPEIAVATVAGLLADRNGRSGGHHVRPT